MVNDYHYEKKLILLPGLPSPFYPPQTQAPCCKTSGGTSLPGKSNMSDRGACGKFITLTEWLWRSRQNSILWLKAICGSLRKEIH